MTLGNSADLVLGQRVVALGYALALEGGPTVTSGIVSSLNRTITAQDPNCDVLHERPRMYTNVIQTDAAINHGNSGGPLVNMAGQVVGINSAGDDNAENIGFAIAIDSAKHTIAATQRSARPAAYLGVSPDRDARPGVPARAQGPERGVRDRHPGGAPAEPRGSRTAT